MQLYNLPVVGRTDAEFYQPRFLKFDSLARNTGQRLDSLFFEIIQPTEFVREYAPAGTGAQFWRAQNVRRGYVDTDNVEFVDWAVFQQVHKSHVREGDVLITRTGANAGDCAVVPPGTQNIAVSSHTLRLVPKDIEMGYAVGVFFASDYGRDILLRAVSGSSRPQITKEVLRSIFLPDFGPIKADLTELMRAFYREREGVETLHAEAEALLLAELELDNLDLSHQPPYTQNYSQVWASGRFDAEYFHPEKWWILEQLDAIPGKTVGDCFGSVRELLSPPERETGEVVYNYDLTDALRFFLDDDVEPVPTHELGSTKKRFQRGDVVASRLRSYLKEIAIVASPDDANCVGSSEYIVLRARSTLVSPELLLVYLRSPSVQAVLKWCQDGSNHPRFKEDELLALKLPDHILKVQEDIKRLIWEGIQASRDSRRLLEEAKRRVEEMVLG